MSEATGDFFQVVAPNTITQGITQELIEEFLATLDDEVEEEVYKTPRTLHESCLLHFFEWLAQRQ